MNEEILQRFELKPSYSKDRIFGTRIIEVAQEIERYYRKCTFDHRGYLSGFEEELDAEKTEEFRVGHACFKNTVARVLQPRMIVEIGVGSGTSALAFLSAAPHAHYVGIDNGEWGERLGHDFLGDAQVWLKRLNYSYEIIQADSSKLEQGILKPQVYDLVHIDGDHSRKAVRHDVKLAWNIGAKWILCDDARDSAVVAGIFDALTLDLERGSLDWAYFPDTWSGNILIRTDMK